MITPLMGELASPMIYQRAIERLQVKDCGRRRLTVDPGGVGIAELVQDQARVARLMARAVTSGRYRMEVASRRVIHVGKERQIFGFGLTDLVLHGAVAEVLATRLDSRLGSAVYSYRRGRSAAHAIRALARYLRDHARVRQPRERGLFVLRTDVLDYGGSVPTESDSALWRLLEPVVGDRAGMALLSEMVRLRYLDGDHTRTLERGLPDGSPLATQLANLYLAPVDELMTEVDGGFYGRYGDDLLFAHPDAEVFAGLVHALDERLAELGLQCNRDKTRLAYFNGAGRPSPVAGFDSAVAIEWLGTEVGFRGTIRLPRRKLRELRRCLDARLLRTRKLLADRTIAEQGPVLCAVIATSLRPGQATSAPHTMLLAHLVDDRTQLAELDRWLCLRVSSRLTGVRGVRSFRMLPPARLRGWGLPSVVATRNRGGRP